METILANSKCKDNVPSDTPCETTMQGSLQENANHIQEDVSEDLHGALSIKEILNKDGIILKLSIIITLLFTGFFYQLLYAFVCIPRVIDHLVSCVASIIGIGATYVVNGLMEKAGEKSAFLLVFISVIIGGIPYQTACAVVLIEDSFAFWGVLQLLLAILLVVVFTILALLNRADDNFIANLFRSEC